MPCRANAPDMIAACAGTRPRARTAACRAESIDSASARHRRCRCEQLNRRGMQPCPTFRRLYSSIFSRGDRPGTLQSRTCLSECAVELVALAPSHSSEAQRYSITRNLSGYWLLWFFVKCIGQEGQGCHTLWCIFRLTLQLSKMLCRYTMDTVYCMQNVVGNLVLV